MSYRRAWATAEVKSYFVIAHALEVIPCNSVICRRWFTSIVCQPVANAIYRWRRKMVKTGTMIILSHKFLHNSCVSAWNYWWYSRAVVSACQCAELTTWLQMLPSRYFISLKEQCLTHSWYQANKKIDALNDTVLQTGFAGQISIVDRFSQLVARYIFIFISVNEVFHLRLFQDRTPWFLEALKVMSFGRDTWRSMFT